MKPKFSFWIWFITMTFKAGFRAGRASQWISPTARGSKPPSQEPVT